MNKLLYLIVLSSYLAMANGPSGYYNKGSLSNAVDIHNEIGKSNGMIVSLSPKQFQFGTIEAWKAIEGISEWFKKNDKAPVLVGDISKQNGGKIARHVGHQNGLGIDIAYISKSKIKKKGHRTDKFHNKFSQAFERNGKIIDDFDLNKNSKLFNYIVNNFNVYNLLVGCAIFKAIKKNKSVSEETLKHLRGKPGHEDHFHLRLRCPKEAKKCKSKWWRASKTKSKRKYPKC